jgi:hypothetical protein
MTLLEGLVIGGVYFVAFLGALLIGAAVMRVIGAERLARLLHLPSGDYE